MERIPMNRGTRSPCHSSFLGRTSLQCKRDALRLSGSPAPAPATSSLALNFWSGWVSAGSRAVQDKGPSPTLAQRSSPQRSKCPDKEPLKRTRPRRLLRFPGAPAR